MLAKTKLIDETLREGIQSPKVYLQTKDKKKVLDDLINAHLSYIEIGMINSSKKDYIFFKDSLKRHDPDRLFISILANKTPLYALSELKAKNYFMITPISDILIDIKFNINHKEYIKNLISVVKLARELKLPPPFVGMEDSARCNKDFMMEMILALKKEGCSQFVYSDTNGILMPKEFKDDIKLLQQIPDIELSVHIHNDSGLAMNNTINAIDMGVEYVMSTINGMGERAGICDTLQLANYLNRTQGNKFDLGLISDLSEFTAKETKWNTPPNQPFIGENLFRCETGTHVAALIENQESYLPYTFFIREKKLEIGLSINSGKKAIHHFLQKEDLHHIEVTDVLMENFKEELNNTPDPSLLKKEDYKSILKKIYTQIENN
ncbi:MAG: hypothetical protein ACEPOW_12660 [Bacteroidales bacterium]